MYERIRSAYRQVNGWAGYAVPASRFVFLQVAALEERATPAAILGPGPPIQAPMVVIAPFQHFDAMLPVAVAPPVGATEANVRPDLFGAGGTEEDEQPDIWQDWFAGQDVAKNEVISNKEETPPEPATFIPNVDPDAVRAVFSADASGEAAAD
jgi:hypothetical protein